MTTPATQSYQGRTKKKLPKPLNDKDYLGTLLARARNRTTNILGDLCKFDIQGIEIPPQDFFDLLNKYGFKDWHPVPIRRKTAARKAITRIRPLLEDPGNDLRVIVRPVQTKEANVVRYAIVDEYTDTEDNDLDYTTRNQVVFRTDTGTMEFTKAPVPEILEAFDYLCSVYTDPEVSHTVDNIIKNDVAITFRDGSGLFFMPHPAKDLVDKLVKLFDDLQKYQPTVCYFRPIAILDDAENRATMGEALIADITTELNAATDVLNHAVEEESQRSLTTALDSFKSASAKAKLYKEMLQINIDGVNQEIDKANRIAADLMVKLADGKTKKKSEPVAVPEDV